MHTGGVDAFIFSILIVRTVISVFFWFSLYIGVREARYTDVVCIRHETPRPLYVRSFTSLPSLADFLEARTPVLDSLISILLPLLSGAGIVPIIRARVARNKRKQPKRGARVRMRFRRKTQRARHAGCD